MESPLAVSTRQTRGRSFLVAASASRTIWPARQVICTGPGTMPPEVARIRGVVIRPFYFSAATPRGCLGFPVPRSDV